MCPFDRLFKIMLKPWVAASYLSFAILSFLYFDQSIAYYFYDLALKTKLPIIYWLTKLGTSFVYITLLFLLAMFFRYLRRNKPNENRCWFLWLCVLVPNLICLVLKVLLGRARPELLFSDNLYGFYGLHFTAPFWSLPSGHTTTIMGLAFGLCVVFPRYFYAILLSGLILISTRILLTSHYLSDVIFTSFLTLLEVGILLFILRRKAWLVSAHQTMHYTV